MGKEDDKLFVRLRCRESWGPYSAGEVIRRTPRAAAVLWEGGKFVLIEDDVEPVDFTAVRGISPAEARKLANSGFKTFEQLAEPSEADRRGLNRSGINRETEAAIRLLQEDASSKGTAAAIARLRGGSVDDLASLEGVGPATIMKLRAAKIPTLAELRNTPQDKLTEVVGKATAEKLKKAIA